LREKGFAGRIRLIGDETGLPYQRPPLSKAYLTGKSDRAALDLRSPGFSNSFDIQIADERRAVKIDRDRKTVTSPANEVLPTAISCSPPARATARCRFPGADLDGVLQLRSAGDADALRQRLAGLKKLVIIGAGFIGLEVAAWRPRSAPRSRCSN